MEIDFGYYFYFLDSYEGSQNKSKIDKFYSQLDIELKSYLDHLLRSLDGYKQQENQLNANLKLGYPDYDGLNAEYSRLFDLYKNDHDEQTAFQLASWQSGIDQIDQEISFAAEEIFYTFQYIRNTFLKSSLIYLYSILEAHLRELCVILKTETNATLDIEELANRNYLTNCYTYLSKVIGLNLDNILIYENTLKDFQNLRNTLVHDFGIITDKKETQIQKVINCYSGISVSEKKLEIKNYSILVSFLQSIIMSFQELYWTIDSYFDYSTLNANLNKALKFISKSLSIQVISVQFNSRLTDAKFVNKTINFDIVNKGRKRIAHGLIMVKTHKTKPSFRINLEKTIHIPKSMKDNYARFVKQLKGNPEMVINQVFQNFYLIQKLAKKIEVTIKPI